MGDGEGLYFGVRPQGGRGEIPGAAVQSGWVGAGGEERGGFGELVAVDGGGQGFVVQSRGFGRC